MWQRWESLTGKHGEYDAGRREIGMFPKGPAAVRLKKSEMGKGLAGSCGDTCSLWLNVTEL